MPEPQSIATLAPDTFDRIERLADRAAAGELPTWSPPTGEVAVHRQPVPPGMPRRFAHARITQLDGALADVAARWIDSAMSANVVLLGNVGVGKTHAAAALAIDAWQSGSTVQFAPVVELLDRLRPGGDPNALTQAIEVDVLVLDDLGGERPTDWTGERLYALINRRWLEQRPIIATSNLARDSIEAALGSRAWSRLYHDAIRWTISGDDRRRGTA